MRFILGAITGLCVLGASCFEPSELLAPMPVHSSWPPLSSPGATSAVAGSEAAARVGRATSAAVGETITEQRPLLDTWSLAAREDGAACRDALKAAGFKFTAYPDKEKPDKNGCGIPHPVVITKGPTGIAY